MRPRFTDTLWLVVKTTPVPAFIFKSKRLILSPSELAIYLEFCRLADKPHSNCTLKTSEAQLSELTTYSSRQVSRAVRGLCVHGLIDREGEKNGGRSSLTKYVMCNPANHGQPLLARGPSALDRLCEGHDRRGDRSLRAVLYGNAEPYFRAPKSLTAMLGPLRGSPLAAYVAVLQLASLRRLRDFNVPVLEWRTLAGIARNETFDEAIDKLEQFRVLAVIRGRTEINVLLKNPASGRDLDDEIFEAEIKADDDRERSTDRPYSPEQLLTWAASVFPHEPKPSSNGEMLVFCQCGGGLQNKRARFRPTLSMNGDKGKYGVYYCHSCERGGTLLQLVMEYGHMDWLKAVMLLELKQPPSTKPIPVE
jgi:hypothetical protein